MAEKFSASSVDTHEQELELLKKLGFTVNPLNKTVDNINQAWEFSQSIVDNKASIKYGIDGVVIKINNNKLVKELGVVGKAPRGWAAIKLPPDEVVSKVVKIIWQVGRTGKITPVVDMEPVDIDGSIVRRATLHNIKQLLEMQLYIGDTIIVHKAGDVIPEVKQILINLRPQNASVVQIPKLCPICNTKLITTDTDIDLYCPNYIGCKAQIVGRLVYYCTRGIANLTGLSQKTLEQFVELYNLHDIADLYNLPYEKIISLEGWGPQSVMNINKSFEQNKTIDDYKFLAGLGINGIGKEVASLICNKLMEARTDLTTK